MPALPLFLFLLVAAVATFLPSRATAEPLPLPVFATFESAPEMVHSTRQGGFVGIGGTRYQAPVADPAQRALTRAMPAAFLPARAGDPNALELRVRVANPVLAIDRGKGVADFRSDWTGTLYNADGAVIAQRTVRRDGSSAFDGSTVPQAVVDGLETGARALLDALRTDDAVRQAAGGSGTLRTEPSVTLARVREQAATPAESAQFLAQTTAPNPPESGRVCALIIGASNYRHLGNQALHYGASDARAMRNALIGGGVAERDILLLTNDQATRQAIVNGVLQHLVATQPEDTIVFYFAGFGAMEPAGEDAALSPDGIARYLIPYDAEPTNPTRTGLDLEDLRGLLAQVPAHRHVVMLDASWNGGRTERQQRRLASEGARALPISEAMRRHRSSPTNAFAEEFVRIEPLAPTGGQRYRPTTMLLVGSRADQHVREDHNLRAGIMTHFVTVGLRGAADANNDRMITATELFDYVMRETRLYTGGMQGPIAAPRQPSVEVHIARR